MFAGALIMLVEGFGVARLERKYREPGEGFLDPIEFLSRASLEDIIRYSIHLRIAFLGFCVFTIGSIFYAL